MKYVKYIFYSFTLIFFGYFIAGQLLLPTDKLDQRNVCYEYTEEWYKVNPDGSESRIAVPGKIEENIGKIKTIVPDDLDKRISCICFRGQDLRAYLDDELIYEYSTANSRWFGNVSPESYLTIPLSYKDAGKTLCIEFVSNTGIIYQTYVGSELGIWVHILRMYAGELLVAVITLIMGTLTVLISKVYGWVNGKRLDITYLGFGVILAAVWLVANSVFRQILVSNVSVAAEFPFLMVMLIPFPFIIYMNVIQENRYIHLYVLAGVIMSIVDAGSCILHVIGKRGLLSTFIYVALGCFCAILSIVATFVMDLLNGKIKEYKFVAVGLFAAFITAVVQLVLYFNRTGIFRGSFLALGLLVLLAGAAMHTIHNMFSIEKDKTAAIIANEAKGKFLANMSHEIRTPINAVLGMNEMILRESREPQIREYALDIQNAGKSLLSLINDILDISKIDSGRLEIIPVEYDVSSMIHDTMNMIYHKAKTKELEVGLNVDESIPSRLLGDDLRIRQVLINLLNNAVKYTNEGGVTLSASGGRKDGKIILHFKIEDTGIGIKEEDLPKLFEEFRRIEENRNRNIEGTGLGMSITVQLLKLMGSRLNVTSEYGKGSCFSFDLEQDIVDDTPIGNLSERIKDQEKEYVYKIGFNAPDADILVVDDNAVNRKVVRNLLKDTLIRIDEADSGEQCLEKIIHKKYDLIFLDHMMPGMDGIETLHAFPRTKGNLNIDVPVVALTANAVTGAKEMYLQNGFIDFITKPVVFKKLEKVIKKYLPEGKIYEGSGIINNENPDDSAQSDTNEKELRDLLENLPEINLEYALLHSNTVQDLYNTMVDFVDMIDAEAEALERYWIHISEEDNLRQYRVKVHSMKASAAIIGAIHLSGMARMLELAAINEKIDTIVSVSPIFLEEWRELKNKLKPISDREAALAKDVEKIELNIDILTEQLKMLKAAMEDMDVDRADSIVELLRGFEYPDEWVTTMENLYTAVSNLDESKVDELVEKMCKEF